MAKDYIALPPAGKFLFYTILVGIIAGLGAVVFYLLCCQVGTHYFLDFIVGYKPPHSGGEPALFSETATPFRRWLLFIVPAVGGLLSGLLVYTFAPEAEGHGTDGAIEAYHYKQGNIRARVPIIKTIASFFTLGTGGSGGREGPIAQIGAGFGSFLANKLRLSVQERRWLMAAGMGAGVGSIFKAPLAGALFAAEVMYRTSALETEVLIPAAIASVVGYCIFCLFFGWKPIFNAKELYFQDPLQLFPYAICSIILAGGAILYIKSFYGVHGFFKKLNIPNHIKPAIGGLLTGIIGYFLPQTLAFGYGYVQQALDGKLTATLLLAIAFGKILTTSFSIGSGGSAGVFGPSIVIGATLGGAIGQVLHHLMPNLVTQPESFVIIGMAGFFAAASNTPVSTIIFVAEMTGSYHLLIPSLLVSTLSFLISRDFTIYCKQVPTRLDSPAHKGDFIVDILEKVYVRDLIPRLRKVEVIPETMKFKDFIKFFSYTQQHYFPVVDEQGRFTGIFSINDIRQYLFDPSRIDALVIKDIAQREIIYTVPSENLDDVLIKFTIKNLNEIPVVDEKDHTKLLGMLTRREVISLYNRRLHQMKSGEAV